MFVWFERKGDFGLGFDWLSEWVYVGVWLNLPYSYAIPPFFLRHMMYFMYVTIWKIFPRKLRLVCS